MKSCSVRVMATLVLHYNVLYTFTRSGRCRSRFCLAEFMYVQCAQRNIIKPNIESSILRFKQLLIVIFTNSNFQIQGGYRCLIGFIG